jgi:hypothetical protein
MDNNANNDDDRAGLHNAETDGGGDGDGDGDGADVLDITENIDDGHGDAEEAVDEGRWLPPSWPCRA